jgi:hypothetical protein
MMPELTGSGDADRHRLVVRYADDGDDHTDISQGRISVYSELRDVIFVTVPCRIRVLQYSTLFELGYCIEL